MRLFNLFKSNTFASMDEIEQMDLADELGITDIKNDVQSIKKQLTDLEASSNWQDNIITAEEATAQLEAKIQAEMPKELGEVFEKIRKAIDNNKNYIVISDHKIQIEHHDGVKSSSISYNPYLEDLEQELKKYHYETDLNVTGLFVSWPKKGKAPVIDPDKKYILPMERTTTSDYMRNYAYYNTGHWLVSGGALDDDWAERSGYTVYGKDILSAPDWVKAIKPIEVEE